MTSIRCPICESATIFDWKWGLRQCSACGVILNPAVWSPEEDTNLQAEWFDQNDMTPEDSAWTRMFESWNAARTWKHIIRTGISSGRLLEVGIGSGSTLAFLRSKGFDVKGCDMSKLVCSHATKVHSISMHCGPLSTMPGRGLYNVIVMNHVLEHVSDPVSFMNDVTRLLRPGGIVHIALPNVTSWEARLSGWVSYQPYHLVYYSAPTLSRVVNRVGLQIESMSTFEPFSGWFLAVLRTLLGRRGTTGAGAAPSRRPIVLDAIYRLAMLGSGGLTWPIRKAQSLLGVGEELVCIAVRQD